jgi:serine protease Do
VAPTALGLRLVPTSPQLAKQYGVEGARGVMVAGVTQGSAAEAAGLQRGDLIERVGQRVVNTPQEVTQAVRGILDRQTDDTKRVALLVNRKGERTYVTVTTEQ